MRAIITIIISAGLALTACGKKAPAPAPEKVTAGSPETPSEPAVAPAPDEKPAAAPEAAAAEPAPTEPAAAPGAEPAPAAPVEGAAHDHAAMMAGDVTTNLFKADPGAEDSPEIGKAVVIMNPTAGHQTHGTIKLTAVEGGVSVETSVEGLPPGKHAYHVHVYGDCTGEDGATAGTHFNFAGSSLAPGEHIDHITGDLGDLEADADGKATATGTIKGASLTGRYSILGRSIIIHEKGNDHTQPPIGAAGGRLACGVIGIVAP